MNPTEHLTPPFWIVVEMNYEDIVSVTWHRTRDDFHVDPSCEIAYRANPDGTTTEETDQ